MSITVIARFQPRPGAAADVERLLRGMIPPTRGEPGCQRYDQLVERDQMAAQKWADLEAQLQRRYDLVPNLVEVVKGYAKHEADTLQAVTEARAKVGSMQVSKDILNNPESLNKFQQAQGELSGALSRLMVVVEKYPDLKANQNFMDLQKQLEGTENRINVERRNFNETVQVYDTKLLRFPTNIIAGMFGFTKKPYFQAQAGSEAAPKVNF